jgi:hypothetical protein
MRKTFAPLDDVLFERLFQPLSDFMSDRLGFGRATAACRFIDLAALCWIMSRAQGLSKSVAAWNAAASFGDMAMLLLGLVALLSLRTLFRRAGAKQANPLRQAMQPHRAIGLLMLAVRLTQLQAPMFADLADGAMLVFAASALYLGACAQRPPVRRDWAAFVPVRLGSG